MKVLMVGAGAVGGYFGGRLVEKGADVTFLVREKRKRELEQSGLVIHSVQGDLTIPNPKLLVAGEDSSPFELIILSVKAYHLRQTMDDIQPYVGQDTLILPLLNGMQHIGELQERFGASRVLGGLCFIETTLNERGEIVHTSMTHGLTYGEWDGGVTPRVEAIQRLFAGSNIMHNLSDNIQRDMWLKYLFIATLSGMTTLMRSSVGPIREAEYGLELTNRLIQEIAAVMKAEEAPLPDDAINRYMEVFNQQGYKMKSSMLRDMEKMLPVEVDHIHGYLLQLAKRHGVETPMLEIVYHNLKVYEKQRNL
jgi:2-dehydropantoate 2-reductase